MSYSFAILYGLIQGLTEFLPVSSSGHLAMLPKLLEMQDPGVAFDLMMHVGTALAVFIYYRKRIFHLCSYLPQAINVRKPEKTVEVFFIRNFILTTLATVLLALVLKPYALDYGRSLDIICFNLIFFGFLMFISDLKNKKSKEKVMQVYFSPKISIFIGLAQALALFPGVSRSGVTLTAARTMGINRKEASHYSFLLSLPLIFAGAILLLPEFFASERDISLLVCLTGLLVSFVVGMLTIHFFLKVVKKIGLGYFSLYRVLFAIYLLNLS